MDVTRGANIEQRLFDAIPPFPREISITEIYEIFSAFNRRSVYSALSRLKAKGCIEIPPDRHFMLRRTYLAYRPFDRRGGANRGQGRRRAK